MTSSANTIVINFDNQSRSSCGSHNSNTENQGRSNSKNIIQTVNKMFQNNQYQFVNEFERDPKEWLYIAEEIVNFF
jgi:hypothetical protein